MSQTPKRTPRTPAKGKGRSQPTVKGCCCKRSQCIKNYCDCYQSMTVCTQFCRCVGCRNTEERMAVEPRTPARNSSAAKRDRAAAMSAKAAAAAAKEGINVQVKPQGRSTPITVPFVPVQQPAMASVNIIRMAPEAFNVVVPRVPSPELMPPPPPPPPPQVVHEIVEVTSVEDISDPVQALSPEPEDPEMMIPLDVVIHKTYNLFVQTINEALLECVLTRAIEAEQMRLNPTEMGRIVLAEFERTYMEVLQKITQNNSSAINISLN